MTRPERDPERTKVLILRICLVLWLVACIALGLIAITQPISPWARWQAAAARATAAHQAQQLQAYRQQSDRDYIAHIQATCGPETWWVVNAQGALVCTTKRGRPTGQVLAGAQP